MCYNWEMNNNIDCMDNHHISLQKIAENDMDVVRRLAQQSPQNMLMDGLEEAIGNDNKQCVEILLSFVLLGSDLQSCLTLAACGWADILSLIIHHDPASKQYKTSTSMEIASTKSRNPHKH